jgi:hypothetical protein
MQDVEVKTPGNAEVIAGLEAALIRAKTGMARAAAIVFCEFQGADVMYMGDVQARAQVMYGCSLLNHLIITGTTNHLHHIDSLSAPAANLWKYDISSDPICFDFLPWLVTAEMVRRREGAPAPLKIAFCRNPNSLLKITDDRWAFFNNVMRPILPLFGAVEDQAAVNGRHADFVALREISAAFMRGETVPTVQVPEQTRRDMEGKLAGRRPVTLTIREKLEYEQRNSNLDEWRKLAKWLTRRGEDVIVVRDTVKAHEPFDEFETCPEASIDVLKRAALYESAKCNFYVANGPWGLAQYSKVPWLMFVEVNNEQPDGFNQPEYWRLFMGVGKEKQIPWATPQQRIVYARDTFDNMRAAYEELHLS